MLDCNREEFVAQRSLLYQRSLSYGGVCHMTAFMEPGGCGTNEVT